MKYRKGNEWKNPLGRYLYNYAAENGIQVQELYKKINTSQTTLHDSLQKGNTNISKKLQNKMLKAIEDKKGLIKAIWETTGIAEIPMVALPKKLDKHLDAYLLDWLEKEVNDGNN